MDGSTPKSGDAWHNLALIYLDQANTDRAIHCFKRVHEISEQDNFAVAELAKLYFKTKKAKDCLVYCNKLLSRGYKPLLAASLKARVLNIVAGYEFALNFFRPYVDHNPDDDALWVVLSEIHEYHDNYRAATQALQTAKDILQRCTGEYRDENLHFVEQKLKHLDAKNSHGPQIADDRH